MRALVFLSLSACSADFLSRFGVAPERAPGTASGDAAVDPAPPAVADTADTADTGGTRGPPEDSGETADTAPPPDPSPPGACDAWGEPTLAGTLGGGFDELSAVAASRRNPGVLYALEDSGGAAEVYAFASDGRHLGSIALAGAKNRDWEDLAVGACGDGGEDTCVWVGDIGDNGHNRTDVTIYRFPEPEIDATAAVDLQVTPDAFPVAYTDYQQDAEALIVTKEGLPVIISKNANFTAKLYRLDTLEPGVRHDLTRVAQIDTAEDGDTAAGDGNATAADLWPDDSRLILRTYVYVWEYDLGEGGVDAAATARRTALPFATQAACEAVAYDPDRRGHWQLAERSTDLWFTPCVE